MALHWVKSTDYQARQPGFKPQLCPFLEGLTLSNWFNHSGSQFLFHKKERQKQSLFCEVRVFKALANCECYVSFVKAKIVLDKVKQERNIFFKTIAIGERPELNLNSTLLK